MRRNDSGLWVVNMDVNSPRMVTSLIPEMSRAKKIENCDDELYCGLPYIVPVMTIMWCVSKINLSVIIKNKYFVVYDLIVASCSKILP